MNLSDLYCTNPAKACRLALRRTVNLDVSERMDTINKLLGLYGVEAIRGEWQNGYWCDIVATYANTGDTYGTTVVCVRGDHSYAKESYFVGSWGDWVERNSDKYAIQ